MPTDQELITQIQAGQQRALTSLYDKYSAALYGVIVRICKDEAVAQDVLQETFVKIWQKSGSYNPEKGKIFTWTYQIARNTALNSIRSQKKLIQKEDIGVYKDVEEDRSEIDVSQLNGCLRKLDPHHQRAIELVYFNGLTHREAHEEMGVPLGTFKSYIQQALKKLRVMYKDELILLLIASRTNANG